MTGNSVGTIGELTNEEIKSVDEIIMRYKGKPGALIPVLEETQEILGYIPGEIQLRIAEGLNISSSKVFGVVTFYSFFTMVPRGRHTIRVCMGTACYVRGGMKNLDSLLNELDVEEGGTTDDRRFTVETVRCIGCCGLAPALIIDDDVHRRVSNTQIVDILKDYN